MKLELKHTKSLIIVFYVLRVHVESKEKDALRIYNIHMQDVIITNVNPAVGRHDQIGNRNCRTSRPADLSAVLYQYSTDWACILFRKTGILQARLQLSTHTTKVVLVVNFEPTGFNIYKFVQHNCNVVRNFCIVLRFKPCLYKELVSQIRFVHTGHIPSRNSFA